MAKRQVAQKGEKSSAAADPKSTFALSKAKRALLPAAERAGADEHLWSKSGGLCALCSRPMDPKDAEPDHRIPTSHDGEDALSNLYLAHRSCNRARGDLPYEIARSLIEFRAFTAEKGVVTFDDVLGRYVETKGRIIRQPVEYNIKDDKVTLVCGNYTAHAQLFTDPATRVKYFFHDVPIVCVQNDVQVQPRVISYTHVRALALDFDKRPVHEPSNCRLVPVSGGTAALLQFDGQHKTTAQILLGRVFVPMKVYVDPSIAMVQALVLKIQQEIKKQPLTRSDTLAKLGDVIKRRLDEYLEAPGATKSESGFVTFQPRGEQRAVKKEYQAELQRLVFFDESNELAQAVKPGVKSPPTTDKVVIERIIKPLVHQELLETDMLGGGERDQERELVVLILNTITRKMLPVGWNAPGNELARRRAQNFFYQGSIGWWMEMLQYALRYALKRMGKPILIEALDPNQRDELIAVVERLCDLEVWSTDDEDDLKAMRSNTVKNMKEQFEEYSWERLID
jgi:hypothetical protein